MFDPFIMRLLDMSMAHRLTEIFKNLVNLRYPYTFPSKNVN